MIGSGKRESIKIKTLVMASFLTALSIVFTRFFYVMIPLGNVQAIRLSFGEAPIMLSGLLFGPLLGGLTGLAADVLGVIINSQGAFFPGFTLSSILWGVIPGILGIIFKRDGESLSFIKILTSVAISYIIISIGLNTCWLSIMFKKGMLLLLPGRIISSIANIPIQTAIISTILKYTKDIVKV